MSESATFNCGSTMLLGSILITFLCNLKFQSSTIGNTFVVCSSFCPCDHVYF
ncbi:hypothetical protein MtrunA17_Chr4g0055791 [Medicago truncatula]|uniref:Uncharacterized protein n=1 Tax=Medicago truncatula TaxID=3880 RepID=A0A396IHF6_MEDTR|nr:hypothetical protein MtrunA17_Chr4g0055791 [Medicago truncatula]